MQNKIINLFSALDPWILWESKIHVPQYPLYPPGLRGSSGSSGSWDTTSDHKIAKAAMKRDPWGDFERAIALKRFRYGFRVACDWGRSHNGMQLHSSEVNYADQDHRPKYADQHQWNTKNINRCTLGIPTGWCRPTQADSGRRLAVSVNSNLFRASAWRFLMDSKTTPVVDMWLLKLPLEVKSTITAPTFSTYHFPFPWLVFV